MKKFVIIDAHALLHRAYHALPPLTSPKGEPAGALYGLSSFLLKILREVEPDYVAACFDRPEPTFRHEAYEEYKGTRAKADEELVGQLIKARDLLGAFDIPVFEEPGFEADDLIATLCERYKEDATMRIIIITGDLDTLQLVDDERVTVYMPGRGISDPVLYDEKAVIKRYGLSPSQLPDYKGLVGDPSDNVPGVKGIGQKSATTLLQKHDTLEKLYEDIQTIDIDALGGRERNMYKKVAESKEEAIFSKQLTILRTDAPLEPDLTSLAYSDPDRDELRHYFKKLGFESLIPRLAKGYTPKSAAGPPSRPARSTPAKQATLNESADRQGQNDLPENVAIIFPEINEGAIAKISVVQKSGTKEIEGDSPETLREVFENEDIEKAGVNLKELYAACMKAGCVLRGSLFDFDVVMWLAGAEEKPRPFAEQLQVYGATGLYTRRKAQLKKAEMENIYADIEMPLLSVLADMERIGIRCDAGRLREVAAAVKKEVRALEEKIYAVSGAAFNINSPKQVSEVLFDRLGISSRGVKKTPGGALSTDAESLEAIRDRHPVIELLLSYRELFKLLTTYIDALPKHIDAVTGRLHTTFNQTGTVTGRLSSENPNMQNIPQGDGEHVHELRASFIAEKGFSLVSFDYSQIELRIAASLSEDETMMRAFREGKDIHTITAAQVAGESPERVGPELRRTAKVLNFGILYGMGASAFAKTSGMSREEAKRFIDAYFAKFPGIVRYQAETIEFGRVYGYVENPLGRRRWLRDLQSSHPRYRSAAERAAINFPIQSLDADIVKMAMVHIARHCREKGTWGENVRMLLQIHDQLLLEIRDDILQETIAEIKEMMEKAYELRVPLVVDVKTGKNWGEMT